MRKPIFDGTDFKHLTPDAPLECGEYDTCTFTDCDCSNADLSDFKFVDCTFRNCNLSMAQLNGAVFRDARFVECKLVGLRWEDCNAFGLAFSFEGCNMEFCSFFQLKIKRTTFKHCRLQEVDFTQCDLQQAVFDQCDLTRAVFNQTILEKADLRTALHYSIDPENNYLAQAKFSLEGVVGLLDKYDIVIE